MVPARGHPSLSGDAQAADGQKVMERVREKKDGVGLGGDIKGCGNEGSEGPVSFVLWTARAGNEQVIFEETDTFLHSRFCLPTSPQFLEARSLFWSGVALLLECSVASPLFFSYLLCVGLSTMNGDIAFCPTGGDFLF